MGEARQNSRRIIDSPNDSDDDKLEQYKIINIQLTRMIAGQKNKIFMLLNEIKELKSLNLQCKNEALKWKTQFEKMKAHYIEHITSMTAQLQLNADKLNQLNETSTEGDITNTTNNQNSNNPMNANVSRRRVSKSFEAINSDSHQSESTYASLFLVFFLIYVGQLLSQL